MTLLYSFLAELPGATELVCRHLRAQYHSASRKPRRLSGRRLQRYIAGFYLSTINDAGDFLVTQFRAAKMSIRVFQLEPDSGPPDQRHQRPAAGPGAELVDSLAM